MLIPHHHHPRSPSSRLSSSLHALPSVLLDLPLRTVATVSAQRHAAAMSTDRRRCAVGAAGSSSTPLATVVVEDTPPIPHDVPSPPPDSDASASDLLLVPDTPLVLDTQSISVSPPPDSLPPLEQPTLPIDSSQPGAPLPSCERPAPHSSSDARAPLRNIENQPPLQPSPSASPPRKRVRVEPSEVQLLSDNMTAALQRLADVQRTQHMELLSEIRARMERDYARAREAEARHLGQMRQLVADVRDNRKL